MAANPALDEAQARAIVGEEDPEKAEARSKALNALPAQPPPIPPAPGATDDDEDDEPEPSVDDDA